MPQPTGKKKKLAGTKKAVPTTAATTRSVSEARSDAPSLATKDNELGCEKTTAAYVAHLKEALKEKMHGGPSEDATMPPPQLHPKLHLRKKSAL